MILKLIKFMQPEHDNVFFLPFGPKHWSMYMTAWSDCKEMNSILVLLFPAEMS